MDSKTSKYTPPQYDETVIRLDTFQFIVWPQHTIETCLICDRYVRKNYTISAEKSNKIVLSEGVKH